MGKIWREIAACFVMALFLPGAVLSMCRYFLQDTEEINGQADSRISESSIFGEEPEGVQILVIQENEPGKMELEAYLTGVVLGEMPWYFEMDALKAQAVAARTYSVKRMQSEGKHGKGVICTDPQCCQAYISPESFLQNGGSSEALEKIKDAVTKTKSQVLLYNGELIEATYFSCSGGSTEEAIAVWGVDIPYLQAKPSPGEENAPYYRRSIYYAKEELEQLLEISLPDSTSEWISEVTYTAGNGIQSITIGEKVYTGSALREKLGLTSTMAELHTQEHGVRIYVKGNGHRVGLSQFGADAMASQGKDYKEILAYYYPGTNLENSWNYY